LIARLIDGVENKGIVVLAGDCHQNGVRNKVYLDSFHKRKYVDGGGNLSAQEPQLMPSIIYVASQETPLSSSPLLFAVAGAGVNSIN
jgi:hypothetical protein